jgi:hypothetical protein
MSGLLLLVECNDPVRAVICAYAAMDADHRLVDFVIPENGVDHARILAITAPYALCFIKPNAASLARKERIGWTNLHTWRILAGTANHHNKASLHTAG